MANKENSSKRNLLKRRGRHFQPLKTYLDPVAWNSRTDPDETKQSVSKVLCIEEAPVNEDIIHNEEAELEDLTNLERLQPYEERLARHTAFFSSRPLMRCLDTDDDEIIGIMLFDRLLDEVRQSANAEHSTYRGELQVRAFWDNVRLYLRDDEDLTSSTPDEGSLSTDDEGITLQGFSVFCQGFSERS